MGKLAQALDRIEELEALVSRQAYQAASQRKRADGLYEQLRRLENTIRNTIVIGEQIDADGLYSLRQRVPNKPRKTLSELRSVSRRRVS